MITKLRAAEFVCGHGIDMVIANGEKPEILYDIVNKEKIRGTLFKGKTLK